MISNTEITKLIENSISIFEKTNPTKRILLTEYADKTDFISASIYADLNKILLIFKNENLVIDFSSILSYSIKDDTETLYTETSSKSETKTNTGSMIGRSLAGAAIAGGAGAIIGGASAKKYTTSFTSGGSSTTSHDYTLYLNINSLTRSSVKIKFGKIADSLFDFSSLLNVIIKRNENNNDNIQHSDIANVGKTYQTIKSEIRRIEIEEKAKREKEDERIKLEIENSLKLSRLAEDESFKKAPWKCFKYLFKIKDLIFLLSIPLGLLCTFTYIYSSWWMIFSYLLFIIVSLVLLGIGNSDNKKNKKETDYYLEIKRESYLTGLTSIVLFFLMLIGFYPILLSSLDVTDSLESYGFGYCYYEGGIFVYLLVALFEFLSAYFIYTSFKEEKKEEKGNTDFFRYKIGLIVGFIISIVASFVMYLGLDQYMSNERDLRKKYELEEIEREKENKEQKNKEQESDTVYSKYHNKYTGEGQNEYQNSSEQENDLKITDELIEKEIENGEYQ